MIGSPTQPPDLGGRSSQALLLPLPGEALVSARTITLAPTTSTRLPSKPAVAARTNLLLEGPILGHIVVSPVLIFGWGPIPCLAPAGAGWGLMLSFAAGSLVLFAYLHSP